jgi:putative heme iron utilization protein
MSEDARKTLSLGAEARSLALSLDRGILATRLARGDQPGLAPGHPYASLVMLAWEEAGLTPLLLLSDLADHTRNLKADPAASLLLDGTEGLAEPLTGPRLTLLGRLEAADPALKQRYAERHPGSRRYLDFKDFNLYRLVPAAAHFVAGFGRIAWLSAAEISTGE